MRSQVEDPTLRFFFEHRKRIEEWYALRDEARALTRELLLEAGQSITPPEGSSRFIDDEGGYMSVLLYRDRWWDQARRKPATGVGFGWGRDPNIETPHEAGGPWYGIWRGSTDKADPLPARLREACGSTLEERGLTRSSKWAWFPSWEVLPQPKPGWYDDLPGWADMTSQLVLDLYGNLADRIERVLLG